MQFYKLVYFKAFRTNGSSPHFTCDGEFIMNLFGAFHMSLGYLRSQIFSTIVLSVKSDCFTIEQSSNTVLLSHQSSICSAFSLERSQFSSAGSSPYFLVDKITPSFSIPLFYRVFGQVLLLIEVVNMDLYANWNIISSKVK